MGIKFENCKRDHEWIVQLVPNVVLGSEREEKQNSDDNT